MAYKSFNPATKTLMKEFSTISDHELNKKLNLAGKMFLYWSGLSISERIKFIKDIGTCTERRKDEFSRLISLEMGKPIRQSRAEVEKCILLCRYYEENAEKWLSPQFTSLPDASASVVFEPTGAIYGIMPWNFPFWQVFRYLIPNLILGNVAFLKHASNVPQCAETIENLLLEVGLPEGVFQNLFIDYRQSEQVIAAEITSGVTLTGSEPAGKLVASLSGKYLKKTVLELGGSDPFIVFEDAEIDSCVKTAIFARFQNAGQSCIAAKRFIVHEKIYEEFLHHFVSACEKMIVGDPLNEQTELGPMATEYLLKDLEFQVSKSIEMGADVLTGGRLMFENSLFYAPTVLSGVKPDMPVSKEEVFGPVAAVFKFSEDHQALSMANDTVFGLGASVWTKNIEKAKKIAGQIVTGTVAINGIVKSHPALPFGGTRKSGYGRELGEWGLKEFANVKTLNIFR
ncbi:MAG: NAD-dependent succinate-semialdehyde dehydrogenase [Sphingobacteriales bacterium]|nr:NAD-dependent succinate-semialdehyde dehydrogenase [Sphingobacteriales bacterium]